MADFIKASLYAIAASASGARTYQGGDRRFQHLDPLFGRQRRRVQHRGNALMDLGHPDEAVKDFDRASRFPPNYAPPTHSRHARVALGRTNLAFQDFFGKAVELMPQSAVPFNGRGMAHAELKRYHAAVRDLSRAISLNPKYVGGLSPPCPRISRSACTARRGPTRPKCSRSNRRAEPRHSFLLGARPIPATKCSILALDDLNKVIETSPTWSMRISTRHRVRPRRGAPRTLSATLTARLSFDSRTCGPTQCALRRSFNRDQCDAPL